MRSRKTRLWIMMFLQYGAWGAWLPVVQVYFQSPQPQGLGVNGNILGLLFTMMPLASLLLSPLFGRLADTRFEAQKLLGILQLVAGISMVLMAFQTNLISASVFFAIHCLAFAPTVGLTSAIGLANLNSPKQEFASVRVGGTIGWIVTGVLLSIWRSYGPIDLRGDLFILGGLCSLLLGIYSLWIPKTAPAGSTDIGRNRRAEVSDLLQNTPFLLFMIVAFVICTQFDSYYMHTSGFLAAPTQTVIEKSLPDSLWGAGSPGLGFSAKAIPLIMALSQVSEIFVMFLLPSMIRRLGMRWTLTIGIAAWPARFAVFVFLPVTWAVIPAMLLHGFCIACLIVAGSIYVEQVAPASLRATAQGLLSSVTMGVGRIVGSLFAGFWLSRNTYKLPAAVSGPGTGEITQLVDWASVFVIPCGVTLACALMFPILYGIGSKKTSSSQ